MSLIKHRALIVSFVVLGVSAAVAGIVALYYGLDLFSSLSRGFNREALDLISAFDSSVSNSSQTETIATALVGGGILGILICVALLTSAGIMLKRKSWTPADD